MVLPAPVMGSSPPTASPGTSPRVSRSRQPEIALKTVGGVARHAEVVLGGLRNSGVRRSAGGLVERRPGAASSGWTSATATGRRPVVTKRADLLDSVPAVADLETFVAFPLPCAP